MALLLFGLGLVVAGGLASAVAGARPERARRLGVGGAVAGSCLGLAAAVRVLVTGSTVAADLPWSVPGGAFRVALDPLAAWFLLPVFGLGAVAAVYGGAYLRGRPGERAAGSAWLFFDLLLASMALVVVARNAVLFLTAWESMAIASFFLVTLDDRAESVRRAGWTYLVAAHLATAFLFVMFALLAKAAGSFDFDGFAAVAAQPAAAGLVLVLAVVGFGTKAGFVPLHVWLPEAHPAAPSHVSAVMSGAMVTMGIYGIVLARAWVGPPQAWWGWLLLGVGAVSAIQGALLALAQTEVKRMLAYSTIENMGIVALGLGLGMLAERAGRNETALLAYGGALLHVLNHSVFKGLLFLGAGSVLHASGTGEMSRLGGLLRRMPRTGAAFLVGAASAAAVPALNGFVGEYVILLAAFTDPGSAAAIAVIVCLAFAGGLAAMMSARGFGIVFLGEPRGPEAVRAHEASPGMTVPLGILAAACVILGLAFPALYRPAAAAVAGALELDRAAGSPPGLLRLQLACLLVAGLTLLVALARRRWSRRPAAAAPTWGCGFARPTPRMQYTASSFSQPITSLFAPLVGMRVAARLPDEAFPRSASFDVATHDPYRESFFAPVFRAIGRTLARLRWFQQGRVQVYVLYIALTLVALLVWSIGWHR